MAPRLQLKRALRSAARFPSRIARHSPSELPFVFLRVQVLSCTALAARDRNGFSDPFVVASLLGERHQTPVAKRTVSPTYVPREATWDFPIYLSAAPGLGAVEIVVWDKDTLGKDYLGEAAIPLGEWFAEGRGFGWDDLSNKPFTVNLESTRVGAVVSGAVSVKLGFVKPTQSLAEIEFDEIYAELLKRSRLSLVSAPPTEGVGTISSSSVLEDDGGLSSDEAESDDESDDDYIDALEEIPMQTTPVRVPANTPPQLTVQPSSPPSPT
ncbi:C2 domain-containing protein C31G5.15, partial [Termitomyces sp. T112]